MYSAVYSEVNISVSGGYVLQYAGGTRASSCFISVTLKSWSGRNILDPTTYMITTKVTRIGDISKESEGNRREFSRLRHV